MSKIANITNTQSTILWKLPQESSTRKPEGKTCWIDVYQYILAHAKGVKEDRAIATFRTNLNELEKPLKSARTIAQVDAIGLKDPKNGQKNAAKNFAQISERLDPIKYGPAIKVIGEFSQQTETQDFQAYLAQREKVERVAIYFGFFKDLNLTPTDILPKPLLGFIAQQPFEGMSQLPISIQSRLCNYLGRAALVQKYDFPAASWKPGKGIDLLFKEVQVHGTIGFAGSFGRGFYTKEPHAVIKIEGQEIFGWNASERTQNADGHYISVVGVKKEAKKDYVIYVDPWDGSDQKFYMLSYENFEKYVTNEYGMQLKPDQQDTVEKQLLEESPSLKSINYGHLPNPPYFELNNLARLTSLAVELLRGCLKNDN